MVYVDDDGKPRAPAVPLIDGLRVSGIAAGATGDVFVVGETEPPLESTHEVVVQRVPPPPP